MPNWCTNTLIISGDKKVLKRFKELAKTKKSKFSLDNFIPYPKIYQDVKLEPMGGDGYNSYDLENNLLSGYNWCINNWGTKWDVTEVVLNEDLEVGRLEYNFDTAWSPPKEAIEKIALMFPTLLFDLVYTEEGCAFEGKMIIRNNVKLTDVCMDMPSFRCKKCGNKQTLRSSCDLSEEECWECGKTGTLEAVK